MPTPPFTYKTIVGTYTAPSGDSGAGCDSSATIARHVDERPHIGDHSVLRMSRHISPVFQCTGKTNKR